MPLDNAPSTFVVWSIFLLPVYQSLLERLQIAGGERRVWGHPHTPGRVLPAPLMLSLYNSEWSKRIVHPTSQVPGQMDRWGLEYPQTPDRGVPCPPSDLWAGHGEDVVYVGV